jgi:ribosomal protein S18 acetylase RimI-like enzyme
MQIERIVEGTDTRFEALTLIYAESFPASERKSIAELRRMLERDSYYFLGACAAGSLVGFSISAMLAGTNAALLEYLAVASEYRAAGVGQELFANTAAHRELSGRQLLIEVESHGHSAARRKAFYRQLGCRQIEGLFYRMPRVSDDDPPPMEVLIYGRAIPECVSKATVRSWLEACYTQVYGMSLADPRIEEMLSPLPSFIRVV